MSKLCDPPPRATRAKGAHYWWMRLMMEQPRLWGGRDSDYSIINLRDVCIMRETSMYEKRDLGRHVASGCMFTKLWGETLLVVSWKQLAEIFYKQPLKSAALKKKPPYHVIIDAPRNLTAEAIFKNAGNPAHMTTACFQLYENGSWWFFVKHEPVQESLHLSVKPPSLR